MTVEINHPILLTAPVPGSVVKVANADYVIPIIAWALVSDGQGGKGAHDSGVEAVFVYEGSAYTEGEWRRAFNLGLEVRTG